jgi:hypothetical protein
MIDDCVNVNTDELCSSWQTDGECQKNPTYMFVNCRKSCMFCTSLPSSIGGLAVPGDSNEMTSSLTTGSVVIMPDTFPQAGSLTYFTVFFVSQTPVNLQVWRQNDTNGFYLVYSKNVVPHAVDEPETVVIDECVLVSPSGIDHIGFTTSDGPSPIAAVYNADQWDRSTYIRQAAATSQPFRQLNIPFSFSLSAGYQVGGTCSS